MFKSDLLLTIGTYLAAVGVSLQAADVLVRYFFDDEKKPRAIEGISWTFILFGSMGILEGGLGLDFRAMLAFFFFTVAVLYGRQGRSAK